MMDKMNKTDFVVVPGLLSRLWEERDDVNHKGHPTMLGAHKGCIGPFATRGEAEEAAVAAGFPTSIVIPRRTVG